MKPTLWLTSDHDSGPQPAREKTDDGTFRPLGEIRRHWAVYLGLVIALIVWCAVDVAPRARIIPDQIHLHMTDFTVYTEAAKAMFDGRDPYATTNVRGWPYIYPPLFALLVSPLAPLPEPWQAAVFFVICAGFAFGGYCEVRWLLDLVRTRDGADRKSESLILILAGAAAAFPTLNCLQRGQAGLFLLYPLLAGLRLALGRQSVVRWIAAGGLLSLAAVAKLTPALPVATLQFMLLIQALIRSDLRSRFAWVTAGTLGGALVYLLLFPGLLVGWNRNITYLETFYHEVICKVDDVRTSDFGGNVSSKRNQSFSNASFRLGNWLAARAGRGPDDLLAEVPGTPMPMDHPRVRQVQLAVRLLALAVLLAAAAIAATRESRQATLAAFGLALVATFVVSPVARGHYFLLWLPGAVFLPLWLTREGHPAARRCALLPALLCILHYVAMDFTARVGLLGLGTTVWFFAGAVRLIEVSLAAPAHCGAATSELQARFVDQSLPDPRDWPIRSGLPHRGNPQAGDDPADQRSAA